MLIIDLHIEVAGLLNKDKLSEMIKGLLEFTIGKSYNSISVQDVYNNEGSILYEIKKAILNGATRTLYYDSEKHLSEQLDRMIQIKDTPKLTREQLSNRNEVKNYFEDAVII